MPDVRPAAVVDVTGAPGIHRALRRLQRPTLGQRIRRILSTIVELLRSDVYFRRGGFPYECHLCGYQIESEDDRTDWHGLGNCVVMCEECNGAGDDLKTPGEPSCVPCGGRGWFPVPPAMRRPEFRFPLRPLIPRSDANFDGDDHGGR